MNLGIWHYRRIRVLFILFATIGGQSFGGSAYLISSPDPTRGASASGAGDSWAPVMTPDGRFVLFASTALDLVQDTNGSSLSALPPPHQNVFLRDRQSGTTVLVSVNLAGAGGNGNSLPVDVSTNGRYALFESSASDLVAGDTNNVVDVFVRDLVKGTTVLVSVSTNGGSADAASRSSVFTPDGRFVAFVSVADNLVAGDTNRIADIFVRDLQENTTRLVSVGALSTNLSAPNGTCEAPLISADGRFVAFYSTATNLVAAVGGRAEIYVRDLVGESTAWASTYARTALSPMASNRYPVSYNHSLSADGKFVAYETSLDSTVYPPRPGIVLRYNLDTGLTDRVCTNANLSTGAYEDIRTLDMSPDGRFVACVANAIDQTGNTTALVVWDAQTGVSTLASGTTNQLVPAGSTCASPVLDPIGRFLAFFSSAAGLVTNSAPGNYHLYLRDLERGLTALMDVDTNGVGSVVTPATIPRVSAGGRWIAFESDDSSLVPSDHNRCFDVFVRDAASNTTELVSVHDPVLASSTPSGSSSVSAWCTSADGRYIAFASDADDVAPGDTNSCRDVFVRDLSGGSNLLVSVDISGSGSGNGVSAEPVISLDGRYVAFTSSATNLVAGDSNRSQDVFIRDLQTGTTTLVSSNLAGTGPGNNHSYSPQLSGDGRWVLFRSKATNLTTSTASGQDNLFLRDMAGGRTYALTSNGAAFEAMPRNGSLVAFADVSRALAGQIAVWTAQSGTKTYSGVVPGRITALGISPDGNNVAYWAGTNLTLLCLADGNALSNYLLDAGQPASHSGLHFSADSLWLTCAARSPEDSYAQVYLYDLQTHARILVSRSLSTGSSANGDSDSPDISPDGRFVTYRSAASEIVNADNNGLPDVFLFDRITQTSTVLTATQSGNYTANNRSLNPVFTPDGQLLFQSYASDLVGHDFSPMDNLFGVALLYAGIFLPAQDAGCSIHWPSTPGKSYRVQFKENLNDSNWSEANGSITNLGTRAYFNDATSPKAQRFYRVLAF